MDELLIRELTPALLDDYLAYFDRDAFADNPDWAACYCRMYFCPTRQEWDCATAETNRAAMCEHVGAGRVHGYLAYGGGRPVGWCNAAPFEALPSLPHFLDYQPQDAARIGAIACFVVAAPWRNRGLARLLLDTACRGFAERGLAWAEGYPRKLEDSAAHAWPGPQQMYRSAGFEPVAELQHRIVMRKALR
jgi:GNAT superfamily N-acetyltransferase